MLDAIFSSAQVLTPSALCIVFGVTRVRIAFRAYHNTSNFPGENPNEIYIRWNHIYITRMTESTMATNDHKTIA